MVVINQQIDDLDMEANTANISLEQGIIVNESYRLATGG